MPDPVGREPTRHIVDIWRSDLPGGDYGWQCHTCGRDVGGFLSWGSAEVGARAHEEAPDA